MKWKKRFEQQLQNLLDPFICHNPKSIFILRFPAWAQSFAPREYWIFYSRDNNDRPIYLLIARIKIFTQRKSHSNVTVAISEKKEQKIDEIRICLKRFR